MCNAILPIWSTFEFITQMQDVVITSGCIGALDLTISSMAGPGDNVLLPMPHFPGYNITVGALGVECRQYKLLVRIMTCK